jgi:phosphopantetheinyl transferase
MPLKKIICTNPGAWAIWHIEETENELACLALEACPDEILHPAKRLEYLAARALMRHVCKSLGMAYAGLQKNGHGKPFLKNARQHVSLTHSYPYVAAQVQPDFAVGIDIEQPKTKLLRVAPRFLSAAEQADVASDLTKLCVYWCAKEALYKLKGVSGTLFSKHLHIQPFALLRAGLLDGLIRPQPALAVSLTYEVDDHYVMVATQSVTEI